MKTADELPSYEALESRTDGPPGSSWGLFPENPDLGTLNFLTPERLLAAIDLVKRGDSIGLDLDLDAIETPTSHQRNRIEHVVFGNGPCHRDDHLHLYNQAATHFDGLGHMKHHIHGFYDGVAAADVESGRRLGIDKWAPRGIAGRCVLIDIPRHLEKAGKPQLNHAEGEAFGVDLLDDALESQSVERRPGDVVLIRTGWLDFYFNTLDDVGRRRMPDRLRSPGLIQSRETVEWLWDTRVAATLADNAGIECFPPVADSPFNQDVPAGAGVVPGLLHPTLIAMMGMVIGELWWLEDLAADCADDGIYEALFVAKPLNLTGGVGSPANAVAIK